MGRHTPGPWLMTFVERREQKETAYAIHDEHENVVAWVFCSAPNSFGNPVPSSLPAKENAALLRAAPDMLAALKYVFRPEQAGKPLTVDTCRVIQSAIDKAQKPSG